MDFGANKLFLLLWNNMKAKAGLNATITSVTIWMVEAR
jgi:hypothetical protein